MSETKETSTTGGQKGSKLPGYSLIDASFLNELACHAQLGAEKYSRNNWRKGYEFSLSFDALNRHLWEWWNGEYFDDEMGTDHLAAVAFHAMVLYVNSRKIATGDLPAEFDDRFVSAVPLWAWTHDIQARNAASQPVAEQVADEDPLMVEDMDTARWLESVIAQGTQWTEEEAQTEGIKDA